MPAADSQPVSRRDLLIGAGLSSVALAGCDRILSFAAALAGDRMPSSFEAPRTQELDPAHHLLSRIGFGPRPGDLEHVQRVGWRATIEQQLEPDSIDDLACDLRTQVIDTVQLATPYLYELPPEQVELELCRWSLLSAVYSRRQLREVLVEVWSDHLHVATGKGACKRLRTVDYRDVIRRHALGRFRDLLQASALSPAMLVYLDGNQNKVEHAGDRPNENYARELLELHTLGVHGGYSQQDVQEAARCLTGFVVREDGTPGAVEFVPERHDNGEKMVLGQQIPAGGGRSDLDRLLDIVSRHPATERRIAGLLARAFVADDPPAAVIDTAAHTFHASDGDLKATVRAILLSGALEEPSSMGAKIKRPFRFVVSALRALFADTHAKEDDLLRALDRMGHRPFAWPTPDGYPTRSDEWLHTLLPRMRFGLQLARGRVAGVRLDLAQLEAAVQGADPRERIVAHLLGRAPGAQELASISAGGSFADVVGLTLSSPGFQRF